MAYIEDHMASLIDFVDWLCLGKGQAFLRALFVYLVYTCFPPFSAINASPFYTYKKKF